MLENEDPQAIEQDLRGAAREAYREMVEPETPEDAPINDIEPKEAEQVEDEEVEVVAESEATEEVEQPEVEDPIELPELTPNDLWPQDFKEKFPSMPRDAQQFLIDTHRQMQQGLTHKFNEIANYRREQEELNTDFQRIDGFLQHNGIPRLKIQKDAVRHIANIIEDPYPGARLFLKEMGVDINKLVESEEYIDPQVTAANQQVQQLQQRLNQFEQAQANQGLAQAQAELDAFMNETNEQGHLKHPRFEELKPYMHMFYQQDHNAQQPAKPLAEYYAMAERFVLAQTPQSDPQVIQEPKANPVQKAKVASKNIKSKTNTKAPAQMDLRTEIRERMRGNLA